MDLRDLYSNFCPLDYHLNMIKLKDMVTKVNSYPGYSSDVFIDLTSGQFYNWCTTSGSGFKRAQVLIEASR